MNAQELRRKYIEYFKRKNHVEIPTSSLIPENDPSVLFTTAGMHPLVPYLLGEKHPEGKRLTDVQKCLRTGDIDEVGDTSHLTFFEMLGNWSLGDYFKKESVEMSYDFLTRELGISSEKLAVTCFEGDDKVPRDEETAQIWEGLGIPRERIYFYGRKENWWGPAGQTGPCGPDTEIFYDTGTEKCSPTCGPACTCGKYLELWNNVFMGYNKDKDGNFSELDQKNVDTGLGLERVLSIMNGRTSVYDTELFEETIKKLEEVSGKKYDESTAKDFRVIADHIRAATFVLGDDKAVTPSNVDQGYVLRRLIRRTSREFRKLGIDPSYMKDISESVIEQYKDVYPELSRNRDFILSEIEKEEQTFSRTLDRGLFAANTIFDKIGDAKVLSGGLAFKLYQTFGFPIELTEELAKERGKEVDIEEFNKCYREHQEKSRQGAAQKFKGGLSDQSEETTKLHTATHLLNAALKRVLGPGIYQRGSNITPERLRFDFPFERKLTAEERKAVEKLVNEAIEANLPVTCQEMSVEEAKAAGAVGVFGEKYGDRVKVYSIGDFSKEICGGPHVANTGELGRFVITKEQSSSAGVRRIKAELRPREKTSEKPIEDSKRNRPSSQGDDEGYGGR